jgi:hypothetical protein
VEVVAPPAGKGKPAALKETTLNGVSVSFANWSQASLQLTVEYDQQERPVFRDPTTGRLETGSWRKQKLNKSVALANDPDGGTRFTDRRYVYEIIKEGFSVRCHVYEVQNNPVEK